MKSDYNEYLEIQERQPKEEIFIDEDRIIELLYRPAGQTTKNSYWSIYKLGKSPNIFKNPNLKEDLKTGLETKGEIIDYENYFKDFSEDITFKEL